jgi:hypothetical protein
VPKRVREREVRIKEGQGPIIWYEHDKLPLMDGTVKNKSPIQAYSKDQPAVRAGGF